MDKKEQILDLYFNKHLKQTEIAEKVNASQQYISKIIKKNERYENEKSSRKSINAEKRKIAQAEYQKSYVRKKEKDIAYEQLLEQQRQDAIELSYNPHPLSDYAFKKANSSIYTYDSIRNQFIMIRGIKAGFNAPKRIKYECLLKRKTSKRDLPFQKIQKEKTELKTNQVIGHYLYLRILQKNF